MELKPCPFCGSEAEPITLRSGKTYANRPSEPESCPLFGRLILTSDWNTRHSPPAPKRSEHEWDTGYGWRCRVEWGYIYAGTPGKWLLLNNSKGAWLGENTALNLSLAAEIARLAGLTKPEEE